MGDLARRWARRAASFTLIGVASVICFGGLPLWLALAAGLDASSGAPRKWARARTVGFFALYLLCELVGLAVAFALWLAGGGGLLVGRRRYIGWNAALQRWWTGALLGGARRLYSMPLQVDGADCAATGPYLLFVRHASTADTVVPATVIANRFRILFRYVLKKELLWDPCLDVAGNRLPNIFVDRTGAMRERELAAIRSLVADLGARDGVLIYPEGTRFTPAKQQRALARLEQSAPPSILARARRLRRVLPPRKGGPLALIAAAPELDVVFLAHTGLEGAVSFSELIRGGLVGTTIRVKLWRVPAAHIPRDDDGRLEWLFDQWLAVDEWVCRQLDVAALAGQADAG